MSNPGAEGGRSKRPPSVIPVPGFLYQPFTRSHCATTAVSPSTT